MACATLMRMYGGVVVMLASHTRPIAPPTLQGGLLAGRVQSLTTFYR